MSDEGKVVKDALKALRGRGQGRGDKWCLDPSKAMRAMDEGIVAIEMQRKALATLQAAILEKDAEIGRAWDIIMKERATVDMLNADAGVWQRRAEAAEATIARLQAQAGGEPPAASETTVQAQLTGESHG